jgi:predicted transposase YdaD
MIEGIKNIRDVFEEYDKMEVVYEDWLSETRREALREGEQKGRLEGEAKLLLRQLHRRFDPLPEWVETRVRAANAAQLEAWADALLDAGKLADVFGAPPPNGA